MDNIIKGSSKTINSNQTAANFVKLNIRKFKMGKYKSKSELKLFLNLDKFFPSLKTEKYNPNLLNSKKSTQELQRTLSFNKNKMLKNKKDLKELKIQFSKLNEENENNRKIIASILNLDNDVFNNNSKEEILEIIKNNKKEKNILSYNNNNNNNEFENNKIIADSINLMNLKLELNEKKNLLKSKNYEYYYLKENSKYKNYIEMQKQLSNNDDVKNDIISDLLKLKDILAENKNILDQKEEEYKKLSKNYKEVKIKEINKKI